VHKTSVQVPSVYVADGPGQVCDRADVLVEAVGTSGLSGGSWRTGDDRDRVWLQSCPLSRSIRALTAGTCLVRSKAESGMGVVSW